MKVSWPAALSMGIYAYALFLPFSISGAQAAMGFCIAGWIGSIIFTRQVGYRLTLIDWLLMAFLAWVLFSAIFAVDPSLTFKKLRRYWIFLGYFALARACTDRQTVIRALKILVLSAGVVAIYGICQHFFGNAVPRYFAPEVDLWQKTGGYNHAVGLFDHHLTYGNSLALVLAAGLGLVAQMGWVQQAAPYALALALACAALLFSFARSAWLGFFAGVFVFAFRLGRKVLVPVLVGMAVLLLLAALFSPSVRFRMERTLSAGHNLERIAIWETTGHMICDYPVCGIGMGSYRLLAPEYRIGYNVHWTAKSHAHNSYLQVAVENGLPALVLFIVWLAVLLYRTVTATERELDRSTRLLLFAMLAAHVTFCVSSFFQHNLGDAEVAMTWLLLIAMTQTLIRSRTLGGHKEPMDFQQSKEGH